MDNGGPRPTGAGPFPAAACARGGPEIEEDQCRCRAETLIKLNQAPVCPAGLPRWSISTIGGAGWPAMLHSVSEVTALLGSAMFAASLVLMVRVGWLERASGGLQNLYLSHHLTGVLAYLALFTRWRSGPVISFGAMHQGPSPPRCRTRVIRPCSPDGSRSYGSWPCWLRPFTRRVRLVLILPSSGAFMTDHLIFWVGG